MEPNKDEIYHIDCCMGKQVLRSPVKNQAGIKKLVIGTWTDSNGNDPGMNNRTTAQMHGVGIPLRKPIQNIWTGWKAYQCTCKPHQYIMSNIEMRKMKTKH